MGLFERFKSGLQKTHQRFVHEIRRVVSGSPKLTAETVEELKAVLLGADLGLVVTEEIITAARQAFETQGKSGLESILNVVIKPGFLVGSNLVRGRFLLFSHPRIIFESMMRCCTACRN